MGLPHENQLLPLPLETQEFMFTFTQIPDKTQLNSQHFGDLVTSG